MAFSAGYDAVILVNSVDISAYTEKVTAAIKRADMQLPRLGANQVARLVGPAQTDLTMNGWIDPAVTAVFHPLSIATAPATVPISYKPEGTLGADTRTGTAYLLDYDEETDAKNPAMWTAHLVVNGDWA